MFCAIVRLKAYRGSFWRRRWWPERWRASCSGALQVAERESDRLALVSLSGNQLRLRRSASSPMPTTWRPCWSSLALSRRARRRGQGARTCSVIRRCIALAAGAALVMLVGIALNGSLAGYGLALPVARGKRADHPSAEQPACAWAVMVLAGCAPGRARSRSLRSQLDRQRQASGSEAATSVQSREDILAHDVARAIRDYLAVRLRPRFVPRRLSSSTRDPTR